MAIAKNELKWYQSAVVNDTASNGGRISTNLVPTTSNSWWPNITEDQLTAGATQYRKSFLRIDNANNETAYNVRIGIQKPTPGSDRFYLAKGTQTDIQSSFAPPSTLYGSGKLDASVLANATTITVLVEHGATILFRDGGLIRISDQTTVGGAGNAEYVTISGTPSVLGDVVTITLASGLQNGYSSTNTYVASLIEEATVTGSTSNKVVTSVAGTFDANAMTVGNLGSIYQIVTLTFSSATAFTATSDSVTFSPSTGTINSTYAPTHVAVGAAYFSIPPAAFGGTFATGNTVVITTIPPAVPIIEMRVVPSSAASISSQTITIMSFISS